MDAKRYQSKFLNVIIALNTIQKKIKFDHTKHALYEKIKDKIMSNVSFRKVGYNVLKLKFTYFPSI